MVSGSGSSSKSKSKQQSGAKFNQDFMDSVRNYAGADPTADPANRPAYVNADFTPVEGGDFNRLEQNLYEGQSSKLKYAYDQSVARQREELSQSGGLNSPSQYLQGSARSSIDKGYLDSTQQAARDAAVSVLGLKAGEAARKTSFDVGEATRKTGYNQTAYENIYKSFLNKLQLALESGKYSTGENTSRGSSGGGGILYMGGSNSSNSKA